MTRRASNFVSSELTTRTSSILGLSLILFSYVLAKNATLLVDIRPRGALDFHRGKHREAVARILPSCACSIVMTLFAVIQQAPALCHWCSLARCRRRGSLGDRNHRFRPPPRLTSDAIGSFFSTDPDVLCRPARICPAEAGPHGEDSLRTADANGPNARNRYPWLAMV